MNVYTSLEGLKKCVIKKNVIKVRTDEYFGDLVPMIACLSNSDKIITTNAYFRKTDKIKFNISDHLLAGKYEQLFQMYSNALNMLNNRLTDIRKKIRLEFTPEQILVVAYLKNNLDYLQLKNDLGNQCARETIIKNFQMIPIDDLGCYRIPYETKFLLSGKQMDKDLHAMICEVKDMAEI